jgi:lipopolysaccharide export system protein LptC
MTPAWRARQDRLVNWFPALALGLLALVTWWLDAKVAAGLGGAKSALRHEPDYYLERFVATRLGEDGRVHQSLQAEKLSHFPDDQTVHLVAPRMQTTDVDGYRILATSREGVVQDSGESAFLAGAVHVERIPPAGRDDARGTVTLETEALTVMPDKQRMETELPVTITDRRAIIRGTGMEFEGKSRLLKLHADVHAQIQPAR